MFLKLLVVLVAVAFVNAQEVVILEDEKLQQQPPAVLAQGMVEMSQHPSYQPQLQRILYNLARLPKYREKMKQIFNYLRFPQPSSKIVFTAPMLQDILDKLNDPQHQQVLIDAFLSLLASNTKPVQPRSPDTPWPDVPMKNYHLAHLITPLLEDRLFFQAVAHQITKLLQAPRLQSSWVQFILKFEVPLANRKAALRAFYALIDIPEVKQFVIHAIVLTLQHPHLRPIFMKQFFEMLLSRTMPPTISMQFLKVLYTPMSDEDLTSHLFSTLQEPRIRKRITLMVLNILFEPRLRPLVIGVALNVLQHPMFFPVVLYHTQQIMIYLMRNPVAMDYVLALLRVQQARPLVNQLVLLLLRQPVQVSYMQALMQKDTVLSDFLSLVFKEPEVQSVAWVIFMIRQKMLSSTAPNPRLVSYVTYQLQSPGIRAYVSNYLLNLYYQPSLTAYMKKLFPEVLIAQMYRILQDEINIQKVFVQKIKFDCEKSVVIVNPQSQIPVIPIPVPSGGVIPMPPPPPPPAPPLPPRTPRPGVFWIPRPPGKIPRPPLPPLPRPPFVIPLPRPDWEIPLPPLPPGPFCPPPMIIREPVYIPMVPDNGAVAHMIRSILDMVHQQNYQRAFASIEKLLINPNMQHQAVLQLLQQPLLRPFLMKVLANMVENPQLMSAIAPMLLAAFRKAAQDTVVFRDLLMDDLMSASFIEILMKMARPELQSEMFSFLQDFIQNSGIDASLQVYVFNMLNTEGMDPRNLERIGDILRKRSL